MSAAAVITRGYGSGSAGLVISRGYVSAEPTAGKLCASVNVYPALTGVMDVEPALRGSVDVEPVLLGDISFRRCT